MSSEPVYLYLPGDVRIAVPPSLSCLTTYVLLEHEDWFEEDIHFVRQHLKPGMMVIDVGANFGVYALTAANVVGNTGYVWAIEPGHQACTHLQCSIEYQQRTNITLIKAALSSQDGQGFLAHGGTDELNHLSEDTSGAGEHVMLCTLDSVCEEHGITAVDFFKMDAEGHEAAIIAGGKIFFEHHAPLIMLEVRNGQDERAAIDLFLAAGYVLLRLVPGINALVPATIEELQAIRALNAYVIKPDAIEEWCDRGAVVMDMQLYEGNNPSCLIDYWQRAEWAKDFSDQWQTWLMRGADGQEWRRAMMLILCAQDKTLSPAQRYGCLVEAGMLLSQDVHAIPPLHIQALRVRHCLMMGDRPGALHHSLRMMDIWASSPAVDVTVPLIMPVDVMSGDDIHQIMNITILHLINNLMNRSTIYNAQEAAGIGTMICAPPGHSLLDERQNLLAGFLAAAGKPTGWQPGAKLLHHSPNAAIWSGAGGVFPR